MFLHFKITWMIHHQANPPCTKTGLFLGANKHTAETVEGLKDLRIPEMLFQMEDVRKLIRRYHKVIQQYYVQYLSGYDAIALKECIQVL